MVSAVVLAAGMSTRMGRNKLLLTFRDKPLVVHAVDTLLASKAGEIIVVLGYESEKVWDRLEDYAGQVSNEGQRRRLRLVKNPDYRDGLSTSVRTGVQAVSPEAEAIMIYLAKEGLDRNPPPTRAIHDKRAPRAPPLPRDVSYCF
jgi:molybdenum cofactor cytidylyltransferase